jgi:hypothetical protein
VDILAPRHALAMLMSRSSALKLFRMLPWAHQPFPHAHTHRRASPRLAYLGLVGEGEIPGHGHEQACDQANRRRYVCDGGKPNTIYQRGQELGE